jgi:predicted acylesterase/phospholipase RssA
MKRALVVSGGGSKGAFAVGVIRGLINTFPNLDFDIYVGTSTGSLVVPFAALKEFEALENIYTSQRTENIIRKFNIGDRLGEHSIFDATPLWNLIETNLTDARCQQLLNGQKEIYFNTTCLQTENLTVFTNASHPFASQNYEVKKLLNNLHLRKAVMASACQPVFMPPIKVNKDVPGAGNDIHQYVDGGVREYAGVEMAIDNGATEIFTILLSSGVSEPVNTEFKDLFSILEETISIFTEDVAKNDLILPSQYNEALIYIEQVKNKMRANGLTNNQIDEFFNIGGGESPFAGKVPLKLYTFRPTAPLGGGPGGLTFDPTEMTAMLNKGKQVTDAFVASLNPADVTWA